jgi:hypothetical protein
MSSEWMTLLPTLALDVSGIAETLPSDDPAAPRLAFLAELFMACTQHADGEEFSEARETRLETLIEKLPERGRESMRSITNVLLGRVGTKAPVDKESRECLLTSLVVSCVCDEKIQQSGDSKLWRRIEQAIVERANALDA